MRLRSGEVVRSSALGGSRCPPLHLTERGSADPDLRPMVTGCFRLAIEPRPHQLVVATVLSTYPRRAAVEVPRRAGKTVGLWAWVVGKCVETEDYEVHFTAQSGIKARSRWEDVVAALAKADRADVRADRAPRNLRTKVYRSAGREELVFTDTDSRVRVMPPKAESFIGEESDLWWCDEAQELDAQQSADLVSAVSPTQDTVPFSTMLVSGTAGKLREGLLWDWLQPVADRPVAVVAYGAALGMDVDAESTWWASHPGLVYGSTPIERLRDNHADPQLDFPREYLSIWPTVSGTKLIDPAAWAEGGTLTLRARPDKGSGVVFALDCDTHQRWASVVAVTNLGERRASVEVVRRSNGIGWVASELFGLRRKWPSARFAWDDMPANVAATQELDKARPAFRHQGLTFNDMKDAAAGIVLAITEGRLEHYCQPDLDAAVDQASARRIGDTGFLFARGGLDVTSLVAASVGLFVIDRQRSRRPLRIHTASMGDQDKPA